MNRPNVDQKIYSKLPPLYRKEDAVALPTAYPLERFLSVMGVGYKYLEDKIDGFTNMFDLDKCPAEFLPYISMMFGFDFPLMLTEAEQRKLLKALPSIYKAKGTAKSFEYLAREIYGSDATINAYKATYADGMTPEQYRQIFVEIKGQSENHDFGAKDTYFNNYAELVRPANSIVVLSYNLFFNDQWKGVSSVLEELLDTLVLESVEEIYSGINKSDSVSSSVISDTQYAFVLVTAGNLTTSATLTSPYPQTLAY